MQIPKTVVPHATFPQSVSRPRLILLSSILAILLTLGLFLASILSGATPVKDIKTWMEHHGHIYRLYLENIELHPLEFIAVPMNWIYGLRHGQEIPTLSLDIKFKDMQRLRSIRDTALDKGVYIQEDGHFVPAVIRLSDRRIKAKVRLKGDYLDHLTNNKWAFRVHVKGDEHLFGMRRFSIHHPMGRDYHGEPLFLHSLRDEGILTPRYFFVDVTLNGDSLGRMAFEEHFSSEMLSSQGRRDSVILRFAESLVWASDDGAHRGFKGVFDNIANAVVKPFRPSKIKNSPALQDNLRIATGLLRSFANGSLPASQVFDAKRLGRFIAIAETWGSFHCLNWNNQRYYYNPLTAKLEPIAYDGNTGHPRAAKELIDRRYTIIRSMLADPIVWDSYVRTLRRWQKGLADQSISTKLRPIEDDLLKTLLQHYPFLRRWNYELMEERARTLLGYIDEDQGPVYPQYPKIVHAHFINDEHQDPYLEIANAIPQNVEITDLHWKTTSNDSLVPFHSLRPIQFPLALTGRIKGTHPEPLRLRYQVPPNSSLADHGLTVSYRITGQGRIRTTEAIAYFPPIPQNPLPDIKLEDLLLRHPFLRWNETHRQVEIPAGRWSFSTSLVIPRGVTLSIAPGTTLRFDSKTAFLIKGTVKMLGQAHAPIVLESQHQDPDVGTWQGLAVLRAPDLSQMSHVIVRNTTGIEQNGWKLSAGVTFYESDVHIERSKFLNNQSEDAVNIIRSEFTLTNSQIADAVSDGLDADFSRGRVENSVFDRIGSSGGGDAIDVSGSHVVVARTRISRVADKGMSVGEASSMTASHLTVSDTVVGAASKDGSSLTITDSSFTRIANSALMAYIKKSEFGPGLIDARNLSMQQVQIPAQAQTGNVIRIDGVNVPGVDVDVKSLYQTSMKPGRRNR